MAVEVTGLFCIAGKLIKDRKSLAEFPRAYPLIKYLMGNTWLVKAECLLVKSVVIKFWLERNQSD